MNTPPSVDIGGAPRPAARGGSVRVVQVALGAIWIFDGLLQLQPHLFTDAFVSQVLEPSAQGQPGWVSWLVVTNAHLVGANVAAWNTVFACVQLLIGAGLVMRATVKPALVLSMAWAVGVWALGEGFGGIMSGNTSALMGAPGAVLLYALVGLMAWPASTRRDAARPAVSPRSGGRAHRGAGSPSAATSSVLGELGARIVWAALWVFYAVLWLLPANTARGAIGQQVTSMADGEPGWLARLLTSAGHLLSATGLTGALGLAGLSLVIGLGPLVSRRTAVFLVGGAALSVAFWVFGQAFGEIFTGPVSGTATDPNAGPLVVLMALALLRGRRRGAEDIPATVGPQVAEVTDVAVPALL